MKAALKYDGEDYGGRTLQVYRAEERGFEVFIKNLPPGANESGLRKHFVACGDMRKVNVGMNSMGKCKGFAWITFTTTDAGKLAITMDGSTYEGSTIVVEQAGQHKKGDGKGKGQGKGKDGKGSTAFEVFVRNLPFETDEKTLRTDFLECGEIERMHMPTKGNQGKSMGFAWIAFKTKEGLTKALAYNGDDYGGRIITVEKSGQHGGRKLQETDGLHGDYSEKGKQERDARALADAKAGKMPRPVRG
eukprot:gnl/TRDRNA2_/TRDRNA2_30842_c0_seq2.p1 gnl/TRDRNA2_/TRDRNA2_30842_c0~~gnl/TRDRNA2_/TRDRNA2_30842_c0_seq2.p1  ORF type:complete len:247 (+),score=55.26 gnl/TRDRNA2_/TRDRNA2_30842_c0_seq2:2-742(+)